jgi:phosphonate transport system substrate-binding protein
MNKPVLTLLSAAIAVTMAAPALAYTPRTLHVGFTPWENPQDMARVVAPMTEFLSKSTGKQVQAYVATDYAGVIEAMKAGKVDIAFLAPAAYVLAEKNANAQVILKSQFNGRSTYYGAIFTRVDSGIKSIKDLKGHSFAFVDVSSTSGCVFPKVLMLKAGVNPDRDLRQVIYAGTHDAVALAVAKGRVDAGAAYCNDLQGKNSAWNMFLKSPRERAKIRILGITPPIPADTLAVRRDLDSALSSSIKKAFLSLSSTPAGRARIKALYHVDGFAAANPADYEPVREAFRRVGLRLK